MGAANYRAAYIRGPTSGWPVSSLDRAGARHRVVPCDHTEAVSAVASDLIRRTPIAPPEPLPRARCHPGNVVKLGCK